MSIETQLSLFLHEWYNDSPTLPVRTSGSTGTPKVMLVEKSRMIESAQATCSFLELKPGDTALLCMSLDYIAGKMMVVRALVTGLRLITVEPNGHPLRDVREHIDFAAMVPLQIYNTLAVLKERLRLSEITNTLIGGGAIDAAMEKDLQTMNGQIWSTYGMTETLSHIALRAVNGSKRSDSYTPFDGVNVQLSNESTLVIDAPKISAQTLITNDIAEIHSDGTFTIIGRKDNVICSGGIKIQIEEVENMLHKVLHVPFAISCIEDPKFGESVVLLIQGKDEEGLRDAIQLLPPYWQPKHIFHVDSIPMTTTGKKARYDIKVLARKIQKERSVNNQI